MGWRGWCLVLGVAASVCLFELGDARALTEHEIYVAGSAKQMALEGGWLLPRIGDHYWLEKPPLLHWFVAASGMLFGFSEATVRLPSVLAGLGVVALMTWLSARCFGGRAGVVTGLVQCTAVYFITYARLCEADMMLALIVVAALVAFARLQSIGGPSAVPAPYLALGFWALLGLSNMAKGPGFGPFIILVACLSWCIWQRDGAAVQRVVSWPGFALAGLLAIAWPAYAASAQPGTKELWRVLILERAVSGAGFTQPWWYYLVSWTWQLLPWTGALLLAAAGSYRRAVVERAPADRFLWCWAVVPVALLSFSSGKHHHYIIVPLCALSPLLALGLLRCGLRVTGVAVALVLTGHVYAHAVVLPKRDPSRADRAFLQAVRAMVPADVPLVATGGPEIGRHIFYVEPPPIAVWNPPDIPQRLARGDVIYVLARQHTAPQLNDLGSVTQVAQSSKTRRERSPQDRFTLFRIDKRGDAATGGGE